MPAKAASGAQPVNKLPPAMQWRQNNRLMDEEDDENLIVDVENTDQPAGTNGMYVPNFEV